MTTSQAEIWDDSALIESWNEALEEYKKYHSIKARGENLTEILESNETFTSDVGQMTNNLGDESNKTFNETQEILIQETSDDQLDPKITPDDLEPSHEEKITPLPVMPQCLIGQVHDEGLKNLLMSWYYAGYYTGLYEGKHQT